MYTVGEMARMLHVPASTLRYYDKQGLLPFVERSPGGIRVFKDSDFEWLRIIECMKKAGMSLKDIRIYIELAMQGDSTIDARLAMFRRQQDTRVPRCSSCRTPCRCWNTSAGTTRPLKSWAASTL